MVLVVAEGDAGAGIQSSIDSQLSQPWRQGPTCPDAIARTLMWHG
jgi:hypothetical protein